MDDGKYFIKVLLIMGILILVVIFATPLIGRLFINWTKFLGF